VSRDSVVVHGYQPVGDQRVADGSIVIEGHFPDSDVAAVRDGESYKQWERHEREKFITDAQAIYGVLSNNLPGGTMHELLITMLQAKVNQFVVKE
jgi:hypothetical protein